MVIYADMVFLLNFLVDLFLLLATNRLAGYSLCLPRSICAALLGGIYGALCVLNGFQFLGQYLWRIIFLAMISAVAFGWNKSAISRGILFSFLCMALGGIALNMHANNMISIFFCAGMALLLCWIGFRGKAGQAQYVHVQLIKNGKTKQIIALRDTGHSLKDPVSGQQVLIVGPDLAHEFLGFTRSQLFSPVETLAEHPLSGLRLIPYHAVGQGAGMLLAVKFDQVKLDGKNTSAVVAFAPDPIGRGDEYEALAGGVMA